ncbi:hypothetical protein K466DRAFT_643031 [Polyporus arcularius HHB13444]|uniref:Methyltransferase domain-containing protein n=1 Tax=Polyporus arcularius HHB13444 TaxID=1314778 RepID=A0A5C3PW82_9APHY|nr:hypothetical protein K466DRAFT_643031 [Polyporus arcularius HHB13444]
MADHDKKHADSSKPKPVPLDEELYTIDDQALEFMKSQTGIQDPEEIKKHILAVQAEAYAIYPYPCIRRFSFISLKLGRLPAYQRLLAIGKECKGAILLDIGCCFGNDIRKAVADGFPIEGAIGSDLHPEFWDLGHKLFKSTPQTFPVPFIPGDAFDPAHLEAVPPFYAPPGTPVPQLSTIKSLNPLRGHVSVIHASSFFHLFDEEKQFKLAQSLAGLLSPEPGSMIIGSHGGRPEKGFRTEAMRANSHGITMFCHSPESWIELWDGQIFKKGTVKVEAFLHEVRRSDLQPKDTAPETKFFLLVWSVTRL